MNETENHTLNEGINDREAKWAEAEEMAATITDGLGKPVDKGIKETVVAFTALGFKTRQSCGGHLDHGVAGPWIEIVSGVSTEDVDKKSKEAWDIAETADEQDKPHAEQRRLFKEAHRLRREARKPILREATRLESYLNEFDQERRIPHDRRLTLLIRGKSIRLKSQGTELQEVREDEDKQHKLQEYQAEMDAFTQFLKDKYLNEK